MSCYAQQRLKELIEKKKKPKKRDGLIKGDKRTREKRLRGDETKKPPR